MDPLTDCEIRSDNHTSALRIPTVLDENIAEELAAGRIKKDEKLPKSHISSSLGQFKESKQCPNRMAMYP